AAPARPAAQDPPGGAGVTATTALWGISQVVTADGVRSYPVGFADVAADTAAAGAALRRLGVEPGQAVLYTSLMSEAALYPPFLDATLPMGAVGSGADATGTEPHRR